MNYKNSIEVGWLNENSTIPPSNSLKLHPIFEPDIKPSTQGGIFTTNITYLLLNDNLKPLVRYDYGRAELEIMQHRPNSSEFSMMTLIGCGKITMVFRSFTYETSYQNPYIENFNNNIEFYNYYSEVYCSSFEIRLLASKVPSNIKKLIYHPVLNYINSIPRNKNGTITIIGERLTSNSSQVKAEVKIGNSICSILTLYPNKITCYLIGNVNLESNSKVTLNVDGISNINNLYFNNDIPYISSYSKSYEVLTLYGQCFGKEDSFTIYNDGVPVKFNNVKINEQETVMSFTIPKTLNHVNLSIKSYENKSNSIFIGLSFISRFVTQPLVNGSYCIVKLYNTSIENNLENPVLSFLSNSNEEFKSIGKINQNFSNDVDFTVHSLS
ncbi:hypothetical protein ACTFIR_010220 [Dictyostelium discoideum]